MTPCLPRPSFPLVAALAAALLMLAGCEKPADEDEGPLADQHATTKVPPAQISTTSDHAGKKMLSAYDAVSGYLKDQDPDLREHLQKAATKLVKDKDKWRERLASRQRDLVPRITRLHDQLAKTEGQSAEALRNLRQELSTLESQRAEMDHKLSELEAVTSDTWKSFRDRLEGNDEPPASRSSAQR